MFLSFLSSSSSLNEDYLSLWKHPHYSPTSVLNTSSDVDVTCLCVLSFPPAPFVFTAVAMKAFYLHEDIGEQMQACLQRFMSCLHRRTSLLRFHICYQSPNQKNKKKNKSPNVTIFPLSSLWLHVRHRGDKHTGTCCCCVKDTLYRLIPLTCA